MTVVTHNVSEKAIELGNLVSNSAYTVTPSPEIPVSYPGITEECTQWCMESAAVSAHNTLIYILLIPIIVFLCYESAFFFIEKYHKIKDLEEKAKQAQLFHKIAHWSYRIGCFFVFVFIVMLAMQKWGSTGMFYSK